MTELAEKIQVHLDNPDSQACPFCPAKETEHKWKTQGGDKNSSDKLRKAMNDPSRHAFAQQENAKPKNGKSPNQNKDSPRPNPNPIYTHSKYGDYGDQAHHCISGKEILKGEALEKILKNTSGDYKGETGYSVNTAANGIFLPSYPKASYRGTEDEKYDIVKLAMKAGKGQTHIGGHTGHEHAVGNDYPKAIKKELKALEERIINMSEECPFCVEGDGKPKKPFVPPYKANQWMDNLSKDIARDLQGPVAKWPYFISKYAKRFYAEALVVKPSPNKKQKLM